MKKNYLIFFLLIIIVSGSHMKAQRKFPEWAKGIVWYQIFPERFANGDLKNDPEAEKTFASQKRIPKGWKITPWTSNWFEQSDWEKKLPGRPGNKYNMRRYGGDIQGIINNLDYLKALGVGGIYLNPMFEAESLHKYDGSTYHHMDFNFGPDPEGDRKLVAKEIPDDPSTWVWTSADKLFLELVKEVHKRGMYIIIDGVFNHTGVQFWAFQDIVKNQKMSKYKDWYVIKSFDDTAAKTKFDYKGWWNVKSLPEFNRTKEDLVEGPKKYILNATKRWMDPMGNGDKTSAIDGWRLDVAREVPIGFWRDWNKLVKDANPQAIIIGELWELSSDFISENGVFDALMNYNFAYAVNNYFIAVKKKIKTSEFISKLKEIDKSYPAENLHILQNLMDSHDTERLLSLIKNPDRKYDNDGDEKNINYNPGKPNERDIIKLKNILAFQMTYRGAPMIYYGGEAGMWGADDPHDRKPMVWGYLKYDDEVIDTSSGFKAGLGKYKVEVNKSLLDFYKKIISIRNSSEALKKGDVEFIYGNDTLKSFAFTRTLGSEKILAVFNTDIKEHTITLNLEAESLFDLLYQKEMKVKGRKPELKMIPQSFKILRVK